MIDTMPSLTVVHECSPLPPADQSLGGVCDPVDSDELHLKSFPLRKRFKILEKARIERERLEENEQELKREKDANAFRKLEANGSHRSDGVDEIIDFSNITPQKRKRESSVDDDATELLFRRMLAKEGGCFDQDWSPGKWRRELLTHGEDHISHEHHMEKVSGEVYGKRSATTHRIQAPGIPSRAESSKDASQAQTIDSEEDDGITCNVCCSSDGDPSDPIVFCDGCDLTVHASCYGNPLCKQVPEGDWFCEQCRSLDLEASCCLCNSSKGAMKRTTDRKWAHISCALFVPEVFFRSAEDREPIDCHLIPKRRSEMLCSICKRSGGACVECTEMGCTETFHVSCGLDRDLALEFREGKNGAVVISFCEGHTPRWNQQQESRKERGRYKIVPREQLPSKKRRSHQKDSTR